MKKIYILLIFFLCTKHALFSQTFVFYQTENIHNQLRLNVKTGEVYQIQDNGLKFVVHQGDSLNRSNLTRYELFKTKNMWTYILLDKISGKLWQCQFSVKGVDYIFSIPINSEVLSATSTSKFTIQPLISMFQYYLVNEETGEMWKFQWTTQESKYRWIIKLD